MNNKVNPIERITDLLLFQMVALSLYCAYGCDHFHSTFMGVIGVVSAISCFPIQIMGLVMEASYSKLYEKDYKEDSDNDKNLCPVCGEDGFPN